MLYSHSEIEFKEIPRNQHYRKAKKGQGYTSGEMKN